MYLYNGLRKLGRGVLKHKALFLLLILLQALLLGLFMYITITYQAAIFNTLQEIVQPLQTANYDAQSIQQGEEFISQFAGIYLAYRSLIRQIVLLAAWWLGLFLIVNGALWVLSHQLLEKSSWKSRGRQWIKYVAATILLLGPFLLAAYFILKTALGAKIDPDTFGPMLKYLLYFLGIIYYLMLHAFASLNAVSWEKFTKQFFSTAIRKIHYTLPILTINLILLSAAGYLIYYFLELNQNFALMMGASALLIMALVLTRLYWIACLRELTAAEIAEPEEPHHEKSNS